MSKWCIIIPVTCGLIVGVGIGFMTNLHWSTAGIILVLVGVGLFLIRLMYIDYKTKKESKGG